MDKNEWFREYRRREKAFRFAGRRLENHVYNTQPDAAQSEAFQLYQIIEELATLADTRRV